MLGAQLAVVGAFAALVSVTRSAWGWLAVAAAALMVARRVTALTASESILDNAALPLAISVLMALGVAGMARESWKTSHSNR